MEDTHMDNEILKGLIPLIIVCLVAAWWAWQMFQLLLDTLRDFRRYRRLRCRYGKAAAKAMMARDRKARGEEDDDNWLFDDDHRRLFDDDHRTNPATGLPMYGFIDTEGNPYGFNNNLD